MISKRKTGNEQQVEYVVMEQLVPLDHLLRKIEAALDFEFIYDLVEDKYSRETGRPSIDPVVLIKIVMIQYLFGIRSMRQTIKEITVNAAYRWFLGMGWQDQVPHFTTFGKNYSRRFAGTDLFERIFAQILEECMKRGFVREETLYIDATHIKANANKNKKIKVEAQRQAKGYEKELLEEINRDREAHGKKPFDDGGGGDGGGPKTVTVTQSTTDPESGMFVKGEHERSFAYMAQTACDGNGFVLDYEVAPGNVHDSVSFDGLYEKLKQFDPCLMTMDAGYKTPAILRKLLKDGIFPVMPRVDPKTGKGFFKKNEYVYDEQNDWYICPNLQTLCYSTTNRDGYREYKSKGAQCKNCPHLIKCTKSSNHVKIVTRHVWADYLDMAEEIRLSLGMKDIYRQRKETIERVFADAKDKHGMRYTQYRGRAKVKMEVGLIFACMNLKKLANWSWKAPRNNLLFDLFSLVFFHMFKSHALAFA